MALPDPVVRSDAVDHYATLLDADALPSEALCLTVVRGLSVDEALTRFDAVPLGREVTLKQAGRTSVNAFPDELPTVVAGRLDGWTLLAEDNGFHGSLTDVLARLSAGTVAASVYWNVNLVNAISLAQDGEVLATLDFVTDDQPEGPDPESLTRYLSGLDFAGDHMLAAALTVLERVSGVRPSAGWAAERHPAAVVIDAHRFEFSDVGSWVSINAPAVVAAVPNVSGSALRAHATSVAQWAVETAGIESSGVTMDDAGTLSAQARAEYAQALLLRWNRCEAPDPDSDPNEVLRADVRRRNADATEEYSRVAAAHALSATRAAMLADPVDALYQALFNACQANREQWPALLADLQRRLADSET